MPTGITYPISEGKMTDLSEFALSCARHMGYFYGIMRDAPNGTKLPEKIEPDSYIINSVQEKKEELRALLKMTEQDIQKEFDKQNKEEVEYFEERIKEKHAVGDRYHAMMSKVEEWVPPTSDHIGLKEFMKSQLNDSIRWDCPADYQERPPRRGNDIKAWRDKVVNEARENLRSAEEELEKEKILAKKKTKWLKDLRKSLKNR